MPSPHSIITSKSAVANGNGDVNGSGPFEAENIGVPPVIQLQTSWSGEISLVGAVHHREHVEA